jgi:hypothetical protein
MCRTMEKDWQQSPFRTFGAFHIEIGCRFTGHTRGPADQPEWPGETWKPLSGHSPFDVTSGEKRQSIKNDEVINRPPRTGFAGRQSA